MGVWVERSRLGVMMFPPPPLVPLCIAQEEERVRPASAARRPPNGRQNQHLEVGPGRESLQSRFHLTMSLVVLLIQTLVFESEAAHV